MRRGYKLDVRAVTISLRSTGMPWLEIQEQIAKKYGLKPSIRQMQKWIEEYKKGQDDPSGFNTMARMAEDRFKSVMILAEGVSGIRSMEFSSWLAKHNGDERESNVETAVMRTLFLIESRAGKVNFEKALKQYMKVRNEMFRRNHGSSGTTGATGPTGI